MGVGSLGYNLWNGNWGDAAWDAGGLLLDVGATAIPFVPGGAATAIKVGRSADNVVDAVNAFDNVTDAVRAVENSADNISDIVYRAIPSKQADELLGGNRQTQTLFGGAENFVSTKSDYVTNYATRDPDLVPLRIELEPGTMSHLTSPTNARLHKYTAYDFPQKIPQPINNYAPFSAGNRDKFFFAQLKVEGGPGNRVLNVGFFSATKQQNIFMRSIKNVTRIE